MTRFRALGSGSVCSAVATENKCVVPGAIRKPEPRMRSADVGTNGAVRVALGGESRLYARGARAHRLSAQLWCVVGSEWWPEPWRAVCSSLFHRIIGPRRGAYRHSTLLSSLGTTTAIGRGDRVFLACGQPSTWVVTGTETGFELLTSSK